MKFSPDQIKQAQARLDKHRAGKAFISNDDWTDLNFIVSGRKLVFAHEHSYGFFHVKNKPCNLIVNGVQFVNGVFDHEDYSGYYVFVHEGQSFAVRSQDIVRGSIQYENYEPANITIHATKLTPKDLYVSIHSTENHSLSSSEL